MGKTMDTQNDRLGRAEKIWSGEINPGAELFEKNITLVKRLFEEVWNKGNLSLVDEFLAADFVDYNRPPDAPDGREGYKAGVNMIRTAFPDFHFTLDQILAEDNRVAIRLTGSGTHKGDFLGISPTGKQVTLGSMTFIHIKNGKLAERWGISDIPRVIQQLQG